MHFSHRHLTSYPFYIKGLLLSILTCCLLYPGIQNHPIIQHGYAVLQSVVSPLRRLAHQPIEWVQWATQVTQTRQHLMQHNKQLRDDLLLAETRLRFLHLKLNQYRAIQSLLHTHLDFRGHVLVAHMIASDMDVRHQRVIINQGKDHNVFPGQPVVDQYGVVGQVIAVYPHTSCVQLIIEMNSAVPVYVLHHAIRGIALGTGLHHLKLLYRMNPEDIHVGDHLVTSGLGQRYPAGFPVGKVINVQKLPHQSLVRVDIAPSFHATPLTPLLLLWPRYHFHVDKNTLHHE